MQEYPRLPSETDKRLTHNPWSGPWQQQAQEEAVPLACGTLGGRGGGHPGILPSYRGPRRQQAAGHIVWAREAASGHGGQRARRFNLDTFDGEHQPADHPDLGADGWTHLSRGSFSFIGVPRHNTPDTVEEHARALYRMLWTSHWRSRPERVHFKSWKIRPRRNGSSRGTLCVAN